MGADIMLALLGLLAAYWFISGMWELHTRRRRTKAWWTSRPDLKDWFKDQ